MLEDVPFRFKKRDFPTDIELYKYLPKFVSKYTKVLENARLELIDLFRMRVKYIYNLYKICIILFNESLSISKSEYTEVVEKYKKLKRKIMKKKTEKSIDKMVWMRMSRWERKRVNQLK